MQIKIKFKELHRSRTGRCWRCNGTSYMDQEKGLWVPITAIYQGNKSTILLAKNVMTSSAKNMTIKCTIFFCDRQNQERRSERSILPFNKFAHWLHDVIQCTIF